jgi:uncharacterized Rossmann fold enzyme
LSTYQAFKGITAVAATPLIEQITNIARSSRRSLPRLHWLPEYGRSKGNVPIAIVGGGPSLRDMASEINEYPVHMVAGSAHDYVTGSPDYCVITDPDPEVTAKYLTKHNPFTTYLVASQCHESVFKALEGRRVVMFHCFADEHRSFLDAIEPDWQAIAGGCTCGLRALSIALYFGYTNIHFFGFDSCLKYEKAYAYPLIAGEELEEPLTIRLGFGTPGVKSYRCLPYHIAQADNFKDIFLNSPIKFTPTFHGEGLMKDVYDSIKGFEGVEL